MGKLRHPKPIHAFRVYVPKSTFYFKVFLWNTQKDMLDYRHLANELPRTRCEAYVLSFDQRVKGKKQPIVGEIHFNRKKAYFDCGFEIVTHECFHAMGSVFRRMKFPFEKLNHDKKGHKCEEIFANTLGMFSRRVYLRLMQYGIKQGFVNAFEK